MAIEKIVVDASVVAKWFLIEEHSEQAIALRDDYISGRVALVAPSLLVYEVLNALKYSGVYSREEMEQIAEALDRYGIDLRELRGDLKKRAVGEAVARDLSLYDASYLALAEVLQARLYTADEELVERGGGVAVHVREYEKS